MEGSVPGDRPGRRFTFSQYFLLLLFLVLLALFLWMIRVFLDMIVLAAVFVTLFFGLYRRLVRLLKGRRSAGALASVVILFLGLLLPLSLIANLVVFQAVELYQSAAPVVGSILEQGDGGLIGRLQKTSFARWLRANEIDLRAPVRQGLQYLGTALPRLINRTSQVTLGFIVDLFVLLFTMFFFFRDGERLTEYLKTVVPLGAEHQERIIDRFVSISRATVKGTVLIGTIQGVLGAFVLLVFGVGTWLLWGVVMVLFGILPVLGPSLVLVPAGIIQIVTGRTLSGIGIILAGILFISTIDNLLRPRLVGRDAGMHELMIFFSTLGGIAVFGIMGFIIGPVIAALFVAVLDIYRIEFEEHIDIPDTAGGT